MTSDLDVGMKCIKYMLFISNFMFVMIGFLLISIGSTIRAIYGDFELFMEAHYFSPAILMVAIGVIIFFVALFGCLGAIKESTCLVNTYSFFLAILLILEVSAAIAAYTMRNNITWKLEKNMIETMQDYKTNEYSQSYWDFMQNRLQCCGTHDSEEWKPILAAPGSSIYIYGAAQNLTVPESCCPNLACTPIYERGCLDRLAYIVSECALMLGTGAVCVAFVQLLGVVFAHMLAKAIRRIKTEEERQRQENRQRLYEQLARGQDEKPTPVLYTASNSRA